MLFHKAAYYSKAQWKHTPVSIPIGQERKEPIDPLRLDKGFQR